MTKTLTTLTLLFGLIFQASLFAQEPGAAAETDFFHGTFEEAKAKAKEDGKILFVMAYASWSGPDRYMLKSVFTDKDVAEYYNANFVNMKMDMEKGEGRLLSREWQIRGYPTLLFFGEDGTLVKRYVGAKKAEGLIALGKQVIGE